MAQFNFEIKQAKKLKKLRRKIAIKAMQALLKQSVTSIDGGKYSKSEPIYRMKFYDIDEGEQKNVVEDAFSIADEFIRQEKEATK